MTFTNNFSERIAHVRRLIAEADHILIGAGAGLSAAAGLNYTGADFEREFKPWIERYGITDLYSSSFYPFKTDEERWAYWAKHIWFARYRPSGTPLYRELLQLVATKSHFVITTNVDAQFEKSGFAPDIIFATQGDYAYLQSKSGENKTLVYNEAWVKKALNAIHDCRISTEMIPRHPETGEPLSPNLRCDDTFVEDRHWHKQANAYRHFVEKACTGKLLLLEMGVGFNTPGIIRFPFEQLAASLPQAALVRLNRDYPMPMKENLHDFTFFTEDMNEVLKLLNEK